MPKGKFVTSSKPFVKRLDAALEERPSEFGFEFVAQRGEEVAVEVHKMSMVRSGKDVVLQWYIPFCVMEGIITVNWPGDAPPEYRPNLPLELNKMLLHPQIGKWVGRDGEERVLGLYWDAVNGRFEICDALNPIDGYLPEGGQICLMPALVRWIC